VTDTPGPAYDEGEPPDQPEPRDPRIAAAVARLDGLADAPPVEHVEVYEDVHRVLQESLADAARSSEADHGTDGAHP
jgi:hypothetical protein